MGQAAGGGCTTGGDNTAIGNYALDALTSVGQITAVGKHALGSSTSGESNVAVGYNAGGSLTTASQNTYVGHGTASGHTTGNENSGFGKNSLVGLTTGVCNQGHGAHTLGGTTTGSYNTAMGCSAGNTNTTGSHNMVLGHNCDQSAATNVHEITLGTNSQVGKGSSTAFISPNGGAVYAGNNSADFATTSDRRIKKNIVDNNIGLEKINQIQVRNFEYRTPDEIDELPKHAAINSEGTQLGVIAQEVQGFLPQIIKEETTGCLSVDGSDIKWLLVNAVQELSTQVDELRAEIKTLKGE